MKLAIRVTVSGLSGLTNAYTSVLSATGSFAISGASRCDDISMSPSMRIIGRRWPIERLTRHRGCRPLFHRRANAPRRLLRRGYTASGEHAAPREELSSSRLLALREPLAG